jgi:exonuclease VII large subunit
LRDVWVRGEVSNWKRAASGHLYFATSVSTPNVVFFSFT